MTDTTTDSQTDATPELPRGTHEVFLGVSGVAFVALVLCLVGYQVFGAQLIAGLDEACAEAAFDAGQKFEAAGNLPQAVLKYRQALDGQFKNDELRFMCGRAVGDLLFRQDRYTEAIEAYDALPEAAFSSAGAYTGYVTALWRSGDVPAARELGEIWLARAEAEAAPQQAVWARNVLMQIARDEGDDARALDLGEQILAVEPGNDAAITVARILRDLGRYDDARARVEAMLTHTDSPALRSAGRSLLEQLAADGAGAGGT